MEWTAIWACSNQPQKTLSVCKKKNKDCEEKWILENNGN